MTDRLTMPMLRACAGLALAAVAAPGRAAEAIPPQPAPQAAPQPAPSPAPQPAPPPAPIATPPADRLAADMEAQLRRSGFTDVKLMPNSILVRATDRAGHPVAMVINPATMTEMVVLDPHPGAAAEGVPLTGSGGFAVVPPTATLAGALIGAPVVDAGGAKVGAVKDIAIDRNGVQAYIVGVGGLFGLGDRMVAVAPGALSFTLDKDAKALRAAVAASAEQLKAAPAFRPEDLAKRD